MYLSRYIYPDLALCDGADGDGGGLVGLDLDVDRRGGRAAGGRVVHRQREDVVPGTKGLGIRVWVWVSVRVRIWVGG